ncbi:MAG: LemA family protein, partial [Candidatus Hydrogenedentes bacterium]|nr:LemA family protein [Candidatus Hydrogenedentota bacterium]
LVTYNRLVALRNHCSEAWSNIATELKRRYELVPNLVATVKGYAAHEREVLEEVTRLRDSCVADTGSPAHQAATENQLVQALNKLLIRVEAYPDLKASTNFLELQRELANTEDRIQAARRFYNGNVRELNNLVEMFPSGLIAGACNFVKREFFVVESTAIRQAPAVAV